MYVVLNRNVNSIFSAYLLNAHDVVLPSGNLIAELQVLGVKAHYVKRPYDMSVSLGVHGLRLVDALQSYGPEYELLLSSYDRPKPDSASETPNKGLL